MVKAATHLANRKLVTAVLLIVLAGLFTGATFVAGPFLQLPSNFHSPHFFGSDSKAVSDTFTQAETKQEEPLWAQQINNAYRSHRAVSLSA